MASSSASAQGASDGAGGSLTDEQVTALARVLVRFAIAYARRLECEDPETYAALQLQATKRAARG